MQRKKDWLLAISDHGFNRLRWSLSILATTMASLMILVMESKY